MIVLRLPGTIDDDQLTTSLWQAGCSGIVEDGDDLIAYFDAAIDAPPTLPVNLAAGQWEAMDTTDYVAQYNRDMQPIRIRNVVITPKHLQQPHTEPTIYTLPDDTQVDATRDTDRATNADIVIWLDPGLAFGSGHHVTTQLALEMLEHLSPPQPQTQLLDVGTGSGILAIAAARLGFHAHGIDIDPQTIPVARENAADNLNLDQNNLDQNNLHQGYLNAHITMPTFAHATLDDPLPQPSYDVVIANIYAHVHSDLMPAYARVTKPHGLLVLTGIYQTEGLELVRSHLSPWFSLLSCVQVGDWSLVTALRHKDIYGEA
ncbi:MAG: 50S ribosomal protein L11 methyltransferase [Deinococcota bacterium]